MRIAVLSSWYPTAKSPLYGLFVKTQASLLAKYHVMDILLLKRGILYNTKTKKDGLLTIHKKTSFYLPNKNETLLRLWAHQYYLLFKKKHKENKYDIIHCHDHYGAYAGWYINKKMGIPYIVTVHNSSIQSMTLASWKQSYLPKVLDNARQVIAVGHKLAEILQDNFTDHIVQILPNIVNTDLFKPNKEKKNTSPFRFLFIGDLDKNKGVMRILKAFKALENKNTHLHIIGQGPLKKEAERFIIDNKLSNQVLLEGLLPNSELPAIYNRTHVYISLSLEETFGITIIEAMSCALPIIYTKSGGPEHSVIKHGCVETSKTDISKISNALIDMMNNYNQIDTSKIRQHILDNYSSQSIINRLLLIYKQCIDEE